MKNSSKVPQVGFSMTLPILKTVIVKGKSQYVVLYEDRQLRVPKLDVDIPGLKEVKCRIASVNFFNVPTLERVIDRADDLTPKEEDPEQDSSCVQHIAIDATTTVKEILEARACDNSKGNQSPADPIQSSNNAKNLIDVEKSQVFSKTKHQAWSIENDSVPAPKEKARSICHQITAEEDQRGVKPSILSKLFGSHDSAAILFNDSTLDAYFFKEDESSDFKRWFISTGGLRRRYDILYLLARQILEIHRENMVCGLEDASEVKVTFLNGKVKIEILRKSKIMSGFSSHKGNSSILPPEVNLCRMPVTPLSDCFTFAILVHQLLCFCHPFEGDLVINGGKEPQQLSLTGKLPWIGHCQDSANRRTRIFFDGFFVTDEVLHLLRKTFEDGLHDPLSRPTMHEWCEALEHAYDEFVYCDKCNTHYLYGKEGCCTLCDEQPEKIATLEIRRWFCAPQWNEEDQTLIDKFCLESTAISKRYLQNNGKKIQVWTNHIMIPTTKNQMLFDLELISEISHQKKLIVRPQNNTPIFVMSGTGQVYQKPITSEQTLIVNELAQREFILAVKPFDVEQRVVIIK